MRNLKRVLSLVMAMVMLLGMMTIGAAAASADFTDSSEITYLEAVDVLTAIGVMEGIPVEGSDDLKFDPGMILNRAQAAAMMTRIIAKPANAEKVSANAEQIFIDVPSTHWAAGYIRYCANLGLLAGFEGYFYPDQNLTGVAFAKMLLVALGYNAEYEGYSKIPSSLVGTGSDVQYIEDVYAVGTLTDRKSGIGADQYYTADVVVIELSQKYKTSGEQVFIYDVPEVHSGVTIESVGVIRADGTEDSVDIDLDASTVRNYLPAYGKALIPGLYFMYETDDEGIYTVTQMTRADIAANRYSVGWSATEYGTGDYDYLEILEFTYAGDDDTDLDDDKTGKKPEYVMTEDSMLYQLEYSDLSRPTSIHRDYSADLTAFEEGDDRSDFVGEVVDAARTANANKAAIYDHTSGTGNSKYWNQNDLLVKYNGDDEVVYAISFANFEGDDRNFAQWVWNSVKPEAEEEEKPVLTVKNYVDGVVYTLTNEDGDTLTGTVVNATTTTFAVEEGDYTLTLTEAEGYGALDLDTIYVADNTSKLNPVSNKYTVVVDGDNTVEITGAADINTYTVAEKGSYDHKGLSTLVGVPATVNHGDNLTFTVTPDPGYTIKEVLISGNKLDANENGSYTITNITSDKTVRVNVEAVEHTVTFDYYLDDALVVHYSKSVKIRTGETLPVILGTDAAELYFVGDGRYGAGDSYTIEGITEDTVIRVDVGSSTGYKKIIIDDGPVTGSDGKEYFVVPSNTYVEDGEPLMLYVRDADGNPLPEGSSLQMTSPLNMLLTNSDAEGGFNGNMLLNFGNQTISFSGVTVATP